MATIHPIMIDAADVSRWVARLWWPVLRIGGFVLTAPIASEAAVPAPVLDWRGLLILFATIAVAGAAVTKKRGISRN